MTLLTHCGLSVCVCPKSGSRVGQVGLPAGQSVLPHAANTAPQGQFTSKRRPESGCACQSEKCPSWPMSRDREIVHALAFGPGFLSFCLFPIFYLFYIPKVSEFSQLTKYLVSKFGVSKFVVNEISCQRIFPVNELLLANFPLAKFPLAKYRQRFSLTRSITTTRKCMHPTTARMRSYLVDTYLHLTASVLAAQQSST